MKRIVALIGLASAFAGNAVADVFSRSFGPKGVLFVDRPTLRWQVWAEKGVELTKAWVRLDGELIQAAYDRNQRIAFWTPPQAWQPGAYSIEMVVSTDDGMTVRKQWKIEVRRPPVLGAPSPEVGAVLAEVNAFRRGLGLEDAYRLGELERAAQAHADYLIANSRTGHYQAPNEKLFTGATPGERLNAFGYVGGSMEVVHFGRSTVPESVASLIAAPYHRFAFMQPGRVPMGSAFGSQRLVIDFGEGEGAKVLAHPFNGQRGVPTVWRGNERPNPLRLHPEIQSPPGYPIVFGRFAMNPYRIQFVSAQLIESATRSQVPICVNHPGNDDELTDAVILFPKQPLAPDTEYRASVACKGEDGQSFQQTWTFRTGR